MLRRERRDRNGDIPVVRDRVLYALAPLALSPRTKRGRQRQHHECFAVFANVSPTPVRIRQGNRRSEVLGADDPLKEIQRVHCTIHRALVDYRRPRRSAGSWPLTCELSVELVAALAAVGWSEERARNVDVENLARGEVELR